MDNTPPESAGTAMIHDDKDPKLKSHNRRVTLDLADASRVLVLRLEYMGYWGLNYTIR
jgi:hypothetical protein